MTTQLALDEPKLTPKQRKFLRLYFKYGNGTKAALEAYDTDDPKAASVIASENLEKLRNPVMVLMEKRGLSLGRLLDVLDEGLRAKKFVATHKGNKSVEDYSVRHKYLETAARWLGVEKQAGPQQVSFTQQNYHFWSVSEEEREVFNKQFKKFLQNYYQIGPDNN